VGDKGFILIKLRIDLIAHFVNREIGSVITKIRIANPQRARLTVRDLVLQELSSFHRAR
jgi:hypothetical protein